MADIVVSGNSSGSVTLRAPDVSGTTILTLPTTSGTLVTTAGGSTVPFALGSAAAPSITFTGDTNTGIFSPGADSIGFAEGGVEIARFDSSGNFGLGTASPSYSLDVRRASAGAVARFTGSTDGGRGLAFTSADNGEFLGAIWDYNVLSASGIHKWSINSTERMRIDSSGSLLVGTTTNAGNEKAIFAYADASNNGLGIRETTDAANTAFLIFRASNSGVCGLVSRIGTTNAVAYNTTSSSTTGAALVSSGIQFPATQVASAGANTLDDYEEGTWTPVLNRTSTSPTITYLQREGRYTKVGNMVTCWISINGITVSSAGSGGNSITGLPFPIGNQTYSGTGGFGYNDAFTNTVYGVVMNNNLTQIYFRSGTRSQSDEAGGWANGGYLGLTFSYFVA
jgi:hypothetical protein